VVENESYIRLFDLLYLSLSSFWNIPKVYMGAIIIVIISVINGEKVQSIYKGVDPSK